MPPNITSVTGVGSERPTTGAEALLEIRQRQTERLRAAQAENAQITDVVEEAEKNDAAANDPERPENPQYRVNLGRAGRLTTEVLDTATGDVILRIPPEYVGLPKDEAATTKSDEGKS